MGREAYLARLALGRSAFDAPLRDENGDFILGGQSHINDDKSYIQQWDERGHPQNLTSDRRAKQFRKAQNEVLEACGVIIRKDAANKRKQSAKEVTEDHKLDVLKDENKIGFMLKCIDRFSSNALSWWVDCLRKRLLVFGPTQPTIIDIIKVDFSTRPTSFLFGGFTAWMIAAIARLARRPEISEPIECMNYLEFNLTRKPLPLNERVWDWLERLAFLGIELPFEVFSTLQALGFAVLPGVWHIARQAVLYRRPLLPTTPQTPHTLHLQNTIITYFLRDYLHYEIGWRLYGWLRQAIIRPHRPSKTSIQAAEHDDFVDDASIVGIGRRLGTHTDLRFYGPHSLWLGLPIAFPWLSFLVRNQPDKKEIKKETLTRCAMMESDDDDVYQGPRSITRARNIVSNLESLGVDVEEDFFVDVDRWTRDIAFLDEDEDEEVEVVEITERQLLPHTDVILTEANEQQSRDFPMHSDDNAASQRNSPNGWTRDNQRQQSFEQDIPAPSTPEMGIRRATSLSQITPRAVRRTTETNEPEFDEDMEAVIAEARRGKIPKARKKDNREFRITRVSVFAADSLAWHASSVITSLLLTRIDAIYLRSLAGWFISTMKTSEDRSTLAVTTMVNEQSPLQWQSFRIVLLSFGAECLIRGAIWQLGCQAAMYYGRRYSWGNF